jgi:hypothetical protein
MSLARSLARFPVWPGCRLSLAFQSGRTLTVHVGLCMSVSNVMYIGRIFVFYVCIVRSLFDFVVLCSPVTR